MRKPERLRRLVVTLVGATFALNAAPTHANEPQGGGVDNFCNLVRPGPDGKLTYAADAAGNTIPDFSNSGYGGGGVAIPDVPVRQTLEPKPTRDTSDDTARIQAAIDAVAKLPADDKGFRGTVLLRRGTYRVAGTLTINAGGVVLRGEGRGDDGTVVVAAGTAERNLIEVKGQPIREDGRTAQPVTDDVVPVGGRTLTVASASSFKVGDTVIVRRNGNAAWIREIGMDRIAERPNSSGSTKQWEPFELPFDRVITAIDGNRITVDAPIACAIEKRWGGGSVTKYDGSGRIADVGVERLRAVSEYAPSVTETQGGRSYPADEKHARYLVRFDDVTHAWGRELDALHFYHGVADMGRGAKWVTVQDCASREPVSVLTGGRRYPFSMTGQLLLARDCYSQGARHAFVFGSRVCGPNVFLDCKSEEDHGSSEPHHRWSVGGLYDNVHTRLAIQDRQWMGSGHGWAGANYVAWNCEGELVCQKPPTAQNWAIGFVGKKGKAAFDRPDGHWESFGRHVAPRSLYLKQLEDRLGRDAVANRTP